MKTVKKIIAALRLSVMAAKYYFLRLIFAPTKREDVWLISENGKMARDNGYAFYKFMKENHPEQKIKYVISRKSDDIDKINEDDIVEFGSIEHYRFFIKSRMLISSHLMGFSPDERLFYRLNKYGILFLRAPLVFLQHGIIKDEIDTLSYSDTKLSLFVCSAFDEYKFVKDKYDYPKSVIKLTGLPRYDYLECDSKKIVCVMPTWRIEHRYCNDFRKTNFYRAYQSLLNNEELDKALGEYGYKLLFYPHIETQKYIRFFSTRGDNIQIVSSSEKDIAELICTSSMLVTDYSSVAFDFAYQEKPIIYYQFDEDSYRRNHYKEGYFVYRRDGFGDVVINEDDLIKSIERYLKSCKMEHVYSSKVFSFFAYRDSGNCERVYKELMLL